LPGDDAPLPQASIKALKALGKWKEPEPVKAVAAKAPAAKSTKSKTAEATAAKATMDAKHKARVAKLAAATEKLEQEVAQAAPIAEAPVAPEIKVSASDAPVIPVVG
jgi:hypothetical protein